MSHKAVVLDLTSPSGAWPAADDWDLEVGTEVEVLGFVEGMPVLRAVVVVEGYYRAVPAWLLRPLVQVTA